MRTTRAIGARLLHGVVVILLVSLAVTMLLDLTPGSAAENILGEQATPANVAQLNQELGLDRPVLERWVDWLGNAVQGDFGTSPQNGYSPINDLLWPSLQITAEIVVLAILIALLVSIPLGSYAAYHARSRRDSTITLGTSILNSVPSFLGAILLIYVFAVTLDWFPVTGWAPISAGIRPNLEHAFLPALSVALLEIATFTRVLRADMIETLQSDFVLNARSKGLPPRRIVTSEALRPSSFSLMTLAGLSVGRLISSTVIVETIFAIPGLGTRLINAIYAKDYPMVQAIAVVIAVIFVVVNMTVDALYAVLDPRLKRSRTSVTA